MVETELIVQLHLVSVKVGVNNGFVKYSFCNVVVISRVN